MKIHLSLLVAVSLSWYVCGIQFDDDSPEVGQAKQNDASGFFPSSSEPDDRYSEVSGVTYVDPQSENRKQLNFKGNLNRPPPPGSHQLYQPSPYRPPYVQPINSPSTVSVISKRPANFPYQLASAPSNYHNSYPMDLSNPFYQNYADQFQYPAATSASSYPDYYNPTRYPSPASANINGQQQLLHQPSLHSPNYYTNQYANQFGYQRPSPIYGNSGVGGLSSFFNNIRESAGLGQISQVGTQFSRALEGISANDDLQCVPKILCQMVKSSRRPNQLPSFMNNIPGLSAIISALPSSSPLMNFGRAALLGLSGGGSECEVAYPKCPRDEEKMLLYLNNHRGGFFRFFNGGNSFGDDNYLQQQQLSSQQQTVAGGDQGLNLLALQALADSLNQGNGINLSNLFSSPTNQRPTVQNYQGLPPDQSQSGGFFGMFKPGMLSDVISNLLTGVVGNRFSRRLSKRSLPDENTAEGRHRIEKRIINLKASDVQAEQDFFQASSNDQQQNTLYSLEAPFTFSSGNRISSAQQSENNLALRFPSEGTRLPEFNQGNSISPSDVARRLKMLFPEASGQFRADDDQFNRELLRALVNDRIGKILTGVQQQLPINNNHDVNRYQGYNHRPSQGYATQSQNYYAGSNINSNQYNKGQTTGAGHIVYITNAQGQIEYTLNELTGEKKRYQ